MLGILAVLAIVTLRHDAGADAGALGWLAESLAAIKDWASCPVVRSSPILSEEGRPTLHPALEAR